ncbi:SchA/CurD-like domain-containing protein [Streptomyces sp. NPDC091279]|uniref:SchA/CurD-like domain-containing protein n=1 Tax=unclassified Streptomyces TaxID=2593676 RepID=UPI003816561B
MAFAAVTYRVKPGHEDEIAEIFQDFKRVDTPVLPGADGSAAGRLLGTAVFIKDDVMVRVIQYEGDFSAIAGHMARQQGVHTVEQRLAPFLAEQRDTATPEGFGKYFRNASMRVLTQLSVDDHPAA